MKIWSVIKYFDELSFMTLHDICLSCGHRKMIIVRTVLAVIKIIVFAVDSELLSSLMVHGPNKEIEFPELT